MKMCFLFSSLHSILYDQKLCCLYPKRWPTQTPTYIAVVISVSAFDAVDVFIVVVVVNYIKYMYLYEYVCNMMMLLF